MLHDFYSLVYAFCQALELQRGSSLPLREQRMATEGCRALLSSSPHLSGEIAVSFRSRFYLLDISGLLPSAQIVPKKNITAFYTIRVPGSIGSFCFRVFQMHFQK